MEQEGIEEVPGEVTPEETAQETEHAETKPDSSPDKPQDAEHPEADEDKARKRINKLVWQREEAKREAEYWRRQAEVRAQTPPQQSQTPEEGEPDINDPKFKTYNDYVKALSGWQARQLYKTQQAENERQSRQSREQDSINRSLQDFHQRAEKVREKNPDYDELFETAQISEAMGRSIIGSESGPEIVMYLAKNPDLAAKIYRMGQTDAAREIGKIEARLENQTESVSKAPPPMKNLKPKGEVNSGLSDSMSIQKWMENRRKQLGRK